MEEQHSALPLLLLALSGSADLHASRAASLPVVVRGAGELDPLPDRERAFGKPT
jgi:hypothetical protein